MKVIWLGQHYGLFGRSPGFYCSLKIPLLSPVFGASEVWKGAVVRIK